MSRLFNARTDNARFDGCDYLCGRDYDYDYGRFARGYGVCVDDADGDDDVPDDRK